MKKHLHHIARSSGLFATLCGLSAAAHAHAGHGLPGASHWHSTDVVGYVLAAGIGAALWFTRRK